MKRPSVPFVTGLIGLGLLWIGGYVAYRKVEALPGEIRLKKEFLGALFHRERKERPVTPTDRARMKMRQAEIKRRLLAEFPDLRIEERPVPDDENGFLQIQRLGKHPDFSPLYPGMLDELSDCVHSWDSEKARAVLAKYPAFISEAKRIASLNSQSSTLSHAYYNGFFEARSAKSLHDVFLLQARLAADAGNEPVALEAARHAMQIRNHLHDVEAPSFLTETVVILLDLGRMKLVDDVILPKLGSNSDLSAWQELMGGEANAPARLAVVSRGEWHTSADHLLLPMALADHHQGNLEDPEETARVWSAGVARYVEELKNKPVIGFHNLNGSDFKASSESLSKEGLACVDACDMGQSSWNKGLLRAVVLAAQHHAVMDVLIHEREGRAIPELIDPASGLPFRFDPSTRMIHAPEWEGSPEDVPPLKLPW